MSPKKGDERLDKRPLSARTLFPITLVRSSRIIGSVKVSRVAVGAGLDRGRVRAVAGRRWCSDLRLPRAARAGAVVRDRAFLGLFADVFAMVFLPAGIEQGAC